MLILQFSPSFSRQQVIDFLQSQALQLREIDDLTFSEWTDEFPVPFYIYKQTICSLFSVISLYLCLLAYCNSIKYIKSS